MSLEPEASLPRGDKSSCTGKQKRNAEHLEEGYERRGVSHRGAERRAWHGTPPSAVWRAGRPLW